jgi:dsRNA-specific ribonuclease
VQRSLQLSRRTSRPAQIVRVAQRLKRQLNLTRYERDRAVEECNQAKSERDRLLILAVAYEAMLGAVLPPGEDEP